MIHAALKRGDVSVKWNTRINIEPLFQTAYPGTQHVAQKLFIIGIYTFPIWRRQRVEQEMIRTSVKAFLSATLALCKRRITFLAPSTTAASIRKRCRSSSTLSSNANSKLGSYLSVIRKLSIIYIYILNVLCNDYYSHGESSDNVLYSVERFFFVGKLKVRESIGNSERMDDLIELDSSDNSISTH